MQELDTLRKDLFDRIHGTVQLLQRQCIREQENAVKLEKSQGLEGSFQIERWICDVLKLPEYLGMFIKEGYDSRMSVETLVEKDLQRMGICLKGHRMRIMGYVRSLQTSCSK